MCKEKNFIEKNFVLFSLRSKAPLKADGINYSLFNKFKKSNEK